MRNSDGNSRFLFSGLHGGQDRICNITLVSAIRRLGYDRERMSFHGFRSMASTLLNERGYNSDWIERQLAHCEKNSVRASYNHARYLPGTQKNDAGMGGLSRSPARVL